MNCPVDNVPLVMSERSGVEIDYCPTCRGVWLDRGELDKILDRASREFGGAAAAASAEAASVQQGPANGMPGGHTDAPNPYTGLPRDADRPFPGRGSDRWDEGARGYTDGRDNRSPRDRDDHRRRDDSGDFGRGGLGGLLGGITGNRYNNGYGSRDSDRRYDDDRRYNNDNRNGHGRKRKDNWLSELFD